MKTSEILKEIKGRTRLLNKCIDAIRNNNKHPFVDKITARIEVKEIKDLAKELDNRGWTARLELDEGSHNFTKFIVNGEESKI